MLNLKMKLSEELFERVDFDETRSEKVAFSNYSYWRSTVRTFFKYKVSTVLFVVMVSFASFSFLFPFIAQAMPEWEESYYNPNYFMLDAGTFNQPPSERHWFGTDAIGRDIWARTWYGTRTSLMLGFAIAFFDVTLGLLAGALWGYVKRMDRLMTEVYNVMTNIPMTVYLVLFTYILKPGFWTIVLAMCFTGWLSIARFIRNKVLAIRESEYNIASHCLGTPLRRILTRNIFPFLVSIVIMQVALTIPYSIGSEVFLGFIGLGLPVDQVSLGNLINQGRATFEIFPYQLLFPTVILSFVTVAFYIVGNKFADAADPRNHV